MQSQTRSSKRVPRELRNWRVQGNPPTLRQPFPPTFSANLFCQPLSKPLFPWTPGTGLETRVNGFSDIIKHFITCINIILRCQHAPHHFGFRSWISRSSKAGHNKAGRSDLPNQRFKPDTGKMRKMRKVPLTPEKQGSEEIPFHRAKTRKMRTRKRGKCG